MGSTLQSLNIKGSEAEFVEWLQLGLPPSQQQQLKRAVWNEYPDASKGYTSERQKNAQNKLSKRGKWKREVYPHLSGRVAFRWLV